MTREEAMDCMRAHMEYPKSICTMCKYRYATQPCEVRTAYKMAADALDERPMIDRVLEIISDVRHDVNNGYMFDMVDEIEKRVAALKGGDVEVRE